MSETSMASYGIHLSLLDGMEEDLLLRLHSAGIATRDDLGEHLQTPASRRELARTLGVHPDRIEAIHHLNFVFPTDQAARLFEAERQSRRVALRLAGVERKLNIALGLLGAIGMAAIVLGWLWIQGRPESNTTGSEVAATHNPAGTETSGSTKTTSTPLTLAETEAALVQALRHMGPAVGWSGPLAWSQDMHRAASSLSGDGGLPQEAVQLSRALYALSALEAAPNPNFDITLRARAAAKELAAFPLPGGDSKWSLGTRQVWLRLNTLSMGLAQASGFSPGSMNTEPWEWTAKGFLEAEWRMARLRALPVGQGSVPEWSTQLQRVQHAVNLGRDELHPAAEAWAREIWLPRAQVEFAVMGAMSDAASLSPYSNLSPKAYLEKRLAYVRRAYQTAPEAVKGPMAWLLVETLEARDLVAWLEAHPDIRNQTQGNVWVEAMHVLDTERRRENGGPSPELDRALQEALSHSGDDAGDAWSSRRTAWEASMRPLLVETRAVLSRLTRS